MTLEEIFTSPVFWQVAAVQVAGSLPVLLVVLLMLNRRN